MHRHGPLGVECILDGHYYRHPTVVRGNDICVLLNSPFGEYIFINFVVIPETYFSNLNAIMQVRTTSKAKSPNPLKLRQVLASFLLLLQPNTDYLCYN